MKSKKGQSSNEKNNLVAPVLKWVGGKRQLLGTLKPLLPKKITTYCEPFVGGGVMLFDLQPQKAYINDVKYSPPIEAVSTSPAAPHSKFLTQYVYTLCVYAMCIHTTHTHISPRIISRLFGRSARRINSTFHTPNS